MTDPLEKATSTAPPTLGEGCLSRYDPDALTPREALAALYRLKELGNNT